MSLWAKLNAFQNEFIIANGKDSTDQTVHLPRVRHKHTHTQTSLRASKYMHLYTVPFKSLSPHVI